MTSVGKLQASLASATQETTLALANLNFDFSLIKVEAPAEYKPVGAALSTNRRSAAETGGPHIIARRLATLFASLLPDTPRLITAYGRRAAEITQAPGVNPSGDKNHGPFKDFVGLDGTNIWAAATSGPGAVTAHLLACMLARVWSPAQAVSIWEEMVLERKKQLMQSADSDFINMKDIAAAQLSIDKEQLAEWDSSARAWLRAADCVPSNLKRQKQLMLILGNISLPVSNRSRVFDSVCKAWRAALTTMNKVVGGEAHSIEDGAVLVALSAWHLYPDMVVLGKQSQEILQHDELIDPGGLLTIGLQGASHNAAEGVHWSLSLAHLRYYGQPVLASGTVSSVSGRVTFPQMWQIVLGSVIAAWGVDMHSINEAVVLFLWMFDCFESGLAKYVPSKLHRIISNFSWMRLLAEAADTVDKVTGEEKELSTKLVRLGYRRRAFLTSIRSNHVFGLRRLDIVCLLADVEAQIQFLREILAEWPHPESSLIIRVSNEHDADHMNDFYASVLPSKVNSNLIHTRWCLGMSPPVIAGDRTEQLGKNQIVSDGSFMSFVWHHPPFQVSPTSQPTTLAPTQDAASSGKNRSSSWSLRPKKHIKTPPAIAAPSIIYEFVLGRPSGVSLFRRSDLQWLDSDFLAFEQKHIHLANIIKLFDDGKIDSGRLCKHFGDLGSSDVTLDVVVALRALAGSAILYSSLPGATISPELFSSSLLVSRHWTNEAHSGVNDEYESLMPMKMTRAAAFSCIALFESGSFDFNPPDLEQVMAISIGDSLYVAAPLLSDPAANLEGFEVRRVVGNIGRAGLALLIPPQNTLVRSLKSERWNVVNHELFDGKLENNFTSTTLHLGFTGYEFPMMGGEHGGRFVDAFFIEAVVSVHDSGEWVADLDIMKALSSPSLNAIVQQPHCRSSPAGSMPSHELVAIDNWQELLDAPGEAAVVRAHGNWQARLAAAVVSVVRGHPTILFQGHGCWSCGIKTMEHIESTLLRVDAPREARQSDALTEDTLAQDQISAAFGKTIFIL